MTHQNEIQKLVKAKRRIERKLQELDQKIEHLHFRLSEESRCMNRRCPLDEEDSIEALLSE